MGEVTRVRRDGDRQFDSWAKGYLIAAIFVAFGLLPQIFGGGETIAKVESDARVLVASGKPIEATVRRKWGDSNYQSVEYSFELGGKTYWGLSDPGNAKWQELSVGSKLEVLYLPSDPDVTEYRPDRWLENQRQTSVIGWLISGAGFMALLLVGAFDLARRRGSRLSSTIDSPSRPIAALLVGLLFFVAGMAFQFKILSDIARGVPIPFTVTSFGGEVTRGSAHGWQLLLIGLFPVPFWVVGAYLLVRWREGA